MLDSLLPPELFQVVFMSSEKGQMLDPYTHVLWNAGSAAVKLLLEESARGFGSKASAMCTPKP